MHDEMADGSAAGDGAADKTAADERAPEEPATEEPAAGEPDPAQADEPRPRGRPRDPKRVERVLTAAKQQFIECGFERASLDSIAQASGVSKVTIYSYFPSKAELFQAAVAHRIERAFAGADWDQLDPTKPRDALMRIGRLFLAIVRSPDVIATHRTLYGAIGAERTAAETFYEAGPTALVHSVARYLKAADRAGSLRVRDPKMAAEQYLSLYLGLGHIRGLLGLDLPAAREDESHLKANVELFLRAFGA
jgi:AcrR family transcriptional regulator